MIDPTKCADCGTDVTYSTTRPAHDFRDCLIALRARADAAESALAAERKAHAETQAQAELLRVALAAVQHRDEQRSMLDWHDDECDDCRPDEYDARCRDGRKLFDAFRSARDAYLTVLDGVRVGP